MVDVVVDVVDVVGAVVDVVTVVVATEAATAASALEPSLPHAERPRSAAHTIAIDCRRMPQSAISNQRCNVVATACWPERTHAGMPMP